MGMDLRLLPQYGQNVDFSHDILECDRDDKMFDIIRNAEKQNGRLVPRNGIYSFSSTDGNNTCYGKTIKTSYGEEMNSVQVRELQKVLMDFKTDSWRNKAIIAFLNELPDELEIWLYWH